MRIEVQSCGDFGDQTRAYAEYRVFSMLRNFGAAVRHASVTLAPEGEEHGERNNVVCRVTVTMTDDRHLETAARGRYAYGAIDRAAHRIRSLIAEQPLAVG
jgi:ribosome-associated translation inhibitor RaiA